MDLKNNSVNRLNSILETDKERTSELKDRSEQIRHEMARIGNKLRGIENWVKRPNTFLIGFLEWENEAVSVIL